MIKKAINLELKDLSVTAIAKWDKDYDAEEYTVLFDADVKVVNSPEKGVKYDYEILLKNIHWETAWKEQIPGNNQLLSKYKGFMEDAAKLQANKVLEARLQIENPKVSRHAESSLTP